MSDLNDRFQDADRGKSPDILCDVHGTLVNPERPDLVAWLNGMHAAGKNVVIVSASPEEAVRDIAHLPLHDSLKRRVIPKSVVAGQHVAIVVDDDDPLLMLVFCKTHLDPAKTDFRAMMPSQARPTP